MKTPILIADSDRLLINTLVNTLKRAGFEIFEAEDGNTALELFETNSPQIVVAALDLDVISGYDLFNRIRKSEKGAHLPLIALSDPIEEQEKEQLKTTFDLHEVFARPVNVGMLSDSIKRLTAGSRSDKPKKRKSVELKGDLATRPFHSVLMFLHERRLSGRLTINGADSIVLDIVNGRPYRIENYHIGLGEYLYIKDQLSDEEIEFYRSQIKEVGEEAVEWLIRMGALSIDALRLERERFQIDKLVEVFGWTAGEYSFKGAEPTITPTQLSAINFPELIHRGLMHTSTKETISEFFLENQSYYVVPTRHFFDTLYFLKLEPYEIELNDHIDGDKMLRDLAGVGKGKWEPEQALRSIFAFRVLGMLEMAETPPEKAPVPPFPMRKRPPVEDVGYVKVSIDDFDTLIAAHAEEAEELPEAIEADHVSADDFFSDMEDELGDLADDLDLNSGPVSLAELGSEVPQVDEAQQQLEQELLAYRDSMQTKNYYELFSTTYQKFDFSQMKEQYHSLIRKFSPQNFMVSAGDIMAAAEEVLSHVATAFNTLSNVVSKEQYDETVRKTIKVPGGGHSSSALQIEVQYNSALAFLQTGDFAAAENALRDVLDMQPNHAEATAHMAWAIYAPNNHRTSRTFAEQAMRMLRKAQQQLPEMPEIFAYKGMILLDQEKHMLAEVEFKKALGRRPKMRLALEGLKTIERLKETDKKGFFGKLGF